MTVPAGTHTMPNRLVLVTDGAKHHYLATAIAGERRAGSAVLGYLAVRDEANVTLADHASDPVAITALPAHLLGIWVNEALTGDTVTLEDDGSALFTIPAGGAAGTFYDFKGARFETNFTVNFGGSASAGNFSVLWRLI